MCTAPEERWPASLPLVRHGESLGSVAARAADLAGALLDELSLALHSLNA